MKLTFAWLGMLFFILGTAVFLFATHGVAAQSTELCLDELLLKSNQLASDYNKHVQTVELNPEKHRKMHDRIDKEFAAVKALACW